MAWIGRKKGKIDGYTHANERERYETRARNELLSLLRKDCWDRTYACVMMKIKI